MSWSSDVKSVGKERALAVHGKPDLAVPRSSLTDGGTASLWQGISPSYITSPPPSSPRAGIGAALTGLSSGLLLKTHTWQRMEAIL